MPEKEDDRKTAVFKVKHGNGEDIRNELYAIVDCGGHTLDVVIEHPIYGQIAADLLVGSRREADAFVKQVEACATKPLTELTDGVHYHTVEADDMEILEDIRKRLEELGFLQE